MRPERFLNREHSRVVPHQVSRSGNGTTFVHRALVVTTFLIIGLVGSPGFAAAGPLIVPMEDTGGGATLPSDLRNEETAVRLFDEVFTQKKADVCILLMAANALNHTPIGNFAGPAGFEQFVADAWSAFPDATFVIDSGFTSGNLVTLHWTMRGHHGDAFGERVATDAAVRLEGLTILRFEENMIAESWTQYDRMRLVEQIEAIPAAPDVCPPCREP